MNDKLKWLSMLFLSLLLLFSVAVVFHRLLSPGTDINLLSTLRKRERISNVSFLQETKRALVQLNPFTRTAEKALRKVTVTVKTLLADDNRNVLFLNILYLDTIKRFI